MCEIKGQERVRVPMLLPKAPHMDMCRGRRRCFTYTKHTQSSQTLTAEALYHSTLSAMLPNSRAQWWERSAPTYQGAESASGAQGLEASMGKRERLCLQSKQANKPTPNVRRSFPLLGLRWEYFGRKKNG